MEMRRRKRDCNEEGQPSHSQQPHKKPRPRFTRPPPPPSVTAAAQAPLSSSSSSSAAATTSAAAQTPSSSASTSAMRKDGWGVQTWESILGLLHEELWMFPKSIANEIVEYWRMSRSEIYSERDNRIRRLHTQWGLIFGTSVRWVQTINEEQLRALELMERTLKTHIRRARLRAKIKVEKEMQPERELWEQRIQTHNRFTCAGQPPIKINDGNPLWQAKIQTAMDEAEQQARKFGGLAGEPICILIWSEKTCYYSYEGCELDNITICMPPMKAVEFERFVANLPTELATLKASRLKKLEAAQIRKTHIRTLQKWLGIRNIISSAYYHGNSDQELFPDMLWVLSKLNEWTQEKESNIQEWIPDPTRFQKVGTCFIVLRFLNYSDPAYSNPIRAGDDVVKMIDERGYIRIWPGTPLVDVINCIKHYHEQIWKIRCHIELQTERFRQVKARVYNRYSTIEIDNQQLDWWVVSPKLELAVEAYERFLDPTWTNTISFSADANYAVFIWFVPIDTDADELTSASKYRLKDQILYIPTNWTPQTLTQRLQSIAPFLLKRISS